ncbi:hypothetical protein HFP89_13545 [Wenzhouxiangella sp. XN79A]|uniref:hypothetical protein n=1 Tax=Wenzhouxiangella sp. XN79A TaxID=2724193 RepID=UPI00144A8BEC|nr:hypothetical protein [Wenzhouxiangella sp. XN79A]NKI36189.1 hypothetical protein [Wenzhouxiangella sp. XN79A]
MVLHRIRRLLPRLARFHAVLFVVLWATVVATPCVMAMQSEPPPMATHDCPHCPPQPCHDQAGPPDCDEAEPADRARSVDPGQFVMVLPSASADAVPRGSLQRDGPPPLSALARAGPRPHLVHVRFDE